MADCNTEACLSQLTKALSKQLDGKRAHRVYTTAGRSILLHLFDFGGQVVHSWSFCDPFVPMRCRRRRATP